MIKIGLYGGTFDPIHWGHIKVAKDAKQNGRLDKVIFVPNNNSPLKEEKPYYSNEERLDRINNMLANEMDLYLDTYQITQKAKSYTIDLIEHYHNIINFNTELFYIMGSDALLEFDRYKEWNKILDLAKLIVVQRPKYNAEKFIKKYPQYKNRIKIIQVFNMENGYHVSSTQIRKELTRG